MTEQTEPEQTIEERVETQKRSRVLARHVFAVRGGIAGTVYGTIVVMATLTAAASHGAEPRKLAVLVTSTAVVFWIAHVYAHALSESIELHHRLDWPDLKTIAIRENAMLLSAAAPVAVLVLGWMGILAERTAVWVALGIGLGTLAAQGARYAHARDLEGRAAATVVCINVALGLLIIALKIIVSHA